MFVHFWISKPPPTKAGLDRARYYYYLDAWRSSARRFLPPPLVDERGFFLQQNDRKEPFISVLDPCDPAPLDLENLEDRR